MPLKLFMVDYELHTFPNGIRLVHKQVSNTKIVHCGFVLDVGSRDESADEQGLAHFWEHMAFKGTEKRKAFHILNRLDSVGGELNAYTTKEKICFYASVLDHYFEHALELLTDITFHSIFPEKQIEKERKVILEEMAMYYDAPEDAIQDDFDELIFPTHPLGKNILGTGETVKNFKKDNFEAFLAHNLHSERIVFSYVGSLSFNKVLKVAEKYLKDLPAFNAKRKRVQFSNYKPQNLIVPRSLTQAQCAIGRASYSYKDEKRLPFFTLINILGGPGMNSRLNLALREKYGFVYAIDASYQTYIDTGLFAIFFGTEPGQLDRSVKLVLKELRYLRDHILGNMQLHRAKVQLMGQLAMAEENNINLMLMMGKSILDTGKIDSLEYIFDCIRKVSAQELQDIAQEMFREEELSFLTFVPEDTIKIDSNGRKK